MRAEFEPKKEITRDRFSNDLSGELGWLNYRRKEAMKKRDMATNPQQESSAINQIHEIDDRARAINQNRN